MGVAVVLVLALLLHALVSRRLERTPVTPPMLLTAAGILAYALGVGERGSIVSLGGYLHVAELGLVLLLFTEASRIHRETLRALGSLPVRLLTTGMLLTIALGTVAARVLLPALPLWEAAALAAILAPTDAGLGQVVVTDPRVPLRVRESLGVEAGLNDGLSVPFLLFALACSGSAAGGDDARLDRFVAEQLGLGAVLGVAIGLGGGTLLRLARTRGWMDEVLEGVGLFTLPLLCLLLAAPLGASTFIAAFVAGLGVRVGLGDAPRASAEPTDAAGRMLNLAVFFVFGLVTARSWGWLRWTHAAYAVASLTAIRMLPVWLALRGTGLSRPTVLFMGWFGPRGLASIVLCLFCLEETGSSDAPSDLTLAVVATVLLSILAHGASARPGIAAYARAVARLGPGAPERTAADPAPTTRAPSPARPAGGPTSAAP